MVAFAPLVTAIRGSKDVKGDLNSFDDQLTVQGTTVTVDINGGLGDDQLRGGIGPDRLDGGAGNNFISGGDGNDDLVGGVAADAIDGGRGQDSINGNAGRDTISVNDGDRDTVFCGGGILNDNVVADLQDVFPAGDCENITLTPVGLLPAVGIARLRIGGPGVIARLACPADSARPCAGKATAASVRLRGRRPPRLKTLGTARYSIAKGRSETVRITLTDAEVEALRDVGRLRITSVEPGNELGPKTVFRIETV